MLNESIIVDFISEKLNSETNNISTLEKQIREWKKECHLDLSDAILNSPYYGANIDESSAALFWKLFKKDILNNIDSRRLAKLIIARKSQ